MCLSINCTYTCNAVVQDEGDKVIVCERGDLVFIFNFNPTQSFSDYGVGCRDAGSYKVCTFCQQQMNSCINTVCTTPSPKDASTAV